MCVWSWSAIKKVITSPLESGAAKAAPAKGLQRLPQNPTYTHIERTEGGKAQRLLARFVDLTLKLVK